MPSDFSALSLVKQAGFVSSFVATYMDSIDSTYHGWFSKEVQEKIWEDFKASGPTAEDVINHDISLLEEFTCRLVELRAVPNIEVVFDKLKELIDRDLGGVCLPVSRVFEQASEIFNSAPTLRTIN